MLKNVLEQFMSKNDHMHRDNLFSRNCLKSMNLRKNQYIRVIFMFYLKRKNTKFKIRANIRTCIINRQTKRDICIRNILRIQ